MKTAIERFEEKYEPEPNTGCWLWTGAIVKDGYGQFGFERKVWGAHRWSWFHANGSIPEGLQIDHKCRQRSCVNPAHLEAVTQRENILRGQGIAAKRSKQTHCKAGHALVPDNIIPRPNNNRVCRTCRLRTAREWGRRKYAQMKAGRR